MLVIATIVCLGTVAVNNAMIAAKNSLSDAQTTCPPCQETPNTTTVHPLVAELNNTSIFYQVRRRTTHSREAFEAFLYIGGLSGLVVVSVYCSKMWRDKSNFSVQQKQRIKFTQQEPTDEILVKDMLRQRARGFVQFFQRGRDSRRKQQRHWGQIGGGRDNPDSNTSTYLRMETFLVHGNASTNKDILESSSSDSDLYVKECNSETSDEASTTYALNKRTGEWESHVYPVQTSSEPSTSRYNRWLSIPWRAMFDRNRTATDHTQQRRPLLRVSDTSDTDSDAPVVAIG